jgi:hypothetical protein
LVKLVRAGSVAKAPNKQKDMEPMTRIPKILTGTNTENNNAENPMTTENPLNRMPLPEILNVLVMASSKESPSLR